MTNPHTPAPVEKKVTVATVASYLGGLGLLAILNGVADTNLITELPDVVEVFVAPIIPSLITFIGGYVARHTPRNDAQV